MANDEHPDSLSRSSKQVVAVLLGATAIAGLVSGVAGAGGIAIAIVGAAGIFCAGVVLWWFGSPTRKWSEIGQGVMVSVVLAVVIGVPQYLIAQAEKERDFKISLTLQDDLSGADLEGRDLSGVRLMSKSLERANLQEAQLDDARMMNTNLRRADLTNADLRNADLRYAQLQNASLAGADLHGAILKNANLSDAVLPDVKLSAADLELTDLRRACFADADLRGARLAGANLDGAVLTNADVRGTVFESDLRPAKLTDAGLAGVRHSERTRWPLDFQFEGAVRGEADPSHEASHRPRAVFPAHIVSVADGDTVRIEATTAAGREQVPPPGRTRLSGVNAPDLDDPGGVESKRFVERRLDGAQLAVQLAQPRPDDGGRYLVYFWPSNSETFNEDLLENGHAALQLDNTGNRELESALQAAELRAKKKGIGLWRRCPRPEERVRARRSPSLFPSFNR
jgi:uncharacterized protein YjbI with pentapeptide repeats